MSWLTTPVDIFSLHVPLYALALAGGAALLLLCCVVVVCCQRYAAHGSMSDSTRTRLLVGYTHRTNAIKEGFLVKQGHMIRNWKRRWFVLYSDRLEYFALPMDNEPRNIIPLTDITLALASRQTAKNFCFGIFHPARPSYFIHARDDNEMMDWVRAIRRDDNKVGLIDFETLTVLGKGNFGKVLLVKQKAENKLYAMKVLNKEVVIKRNDIQHAREERNILQKIRHPFIVGLHYAFQTDEKLYMVIDYIPGGDMYFHLRKYKRFSEALVKLWLAELVLALEYLHDKLDIVYRDLKPENILIDADGHLHMTDFGLSKVQKGEDLNTFCGTPYYVAPEMLARKRIYTKGVDWWSLGILCHELLVGQPPFYSGSMQRVYEKIVHAPVRFPSFVGPEPRELIMQLLQRHPPARLGANGGAAEVKAHPFFADTNWEKVLAKQIPTVFKPQIQDAADTRNFDTFFTRQRAQDSEEQLAPQADNPHAHMFEGFSYAGTPVHMSPKGSQRANMMRGPGSGPGGSSDSTPEVNSPPDMQNSFGQKIGVPRPPSAGRGGGGGGGSGVMGYSSGLTSKISLKAADMQIPPSITEGPGDDMGFTNRSLDESAYPGRSPDDALRIV